MKTIPYAKQSIDSEDIKAVISVLKSDYLTQGPKILEFERNIADYCGVKYAVALNSGTSALHAACFAAEISKGYEAITSAMSFAASSNCVLYCGGISRFADILEDTAAIDPDSIKRLINKKTKALIPVDFAGHPAELGEIKKLADKYGLIVIEDAAHALGAEYKGVKVGSCKYSDITILSFHAVKHITTGEGGMALTNRKDFYDKLVMFRSHGITRDCGKLVNKKMPRWFYEMQFLGFNYRITDIQCALGISQLKKLNRFVALRKAIVERYKEAFGGIAGISCLAERPYAKSSWHIFPILVKNGRDKIFEKLMTKNIGVNLHYIPIYLHPYYKKLGYKKGLCPMAEKYYREAITLPLYPSMSDNEVRRVISVTKTVINSL